MAPGPIQKDYVLQAEVDELKEKLDRVTDSLIVLIDTVKLLVHKSYGGSGGDSPQDILERAKKMVDSWEDRGPICGG